jgi:hypothetical protein
MRRALITLTLMTALTTPALADRSLLTQSSQRDFDAAGVRLLRVENPRGTTEVRRSADGRIHLLAYKQVRATRTDRERLARETQLEAGREGDAFAVRVRYPQGPALRISFFELFSGLDTPRVQMDLTLEVPAGIEVELRSSSGDLRTADLAGAQRLATTSGDIVVESASGPLQANATSGDIEASAVGLARLRSVSGDVTVKGATRPVRVNTTSGDIEVSEAADSLRLDSVSGDIQVEGAAGPLSIGTTSGEVHASRVVGPLVASSSSGDLELGTAAGFTRAELSSVSGDVTLDVPKTFGGAVELQTSSGTLEVSLPVQVQSVNRRLLRGTIGKGTGRLLLKSASGDLHVTSGGQGS